MAGRGLEFWVHKFTNHGMPVAGRIINEINKLTGSNETQLNQLTEVVLRDPNLTSHVLRVANSVSYNYGKSPVSTVSRAIVLIGLKGTRALCISLLLIDSMLDKGNKERLLQVMGMSFHAAAQARRLVQAMGENIEEEVFIAALLFNLGEMAFWTTEHQTEDKKRLFDNDKLVRREAMEEILGTSFKLMTRELSKQWRLSETLDSALNPGKTPDRKIVAVLLADKVSRIAQDGWDTQQMQQTISEVERFTGMETDACTKMMYETVEEAAEVARQYGASNVCHFIPTREKVLVCELDTPNEKAKSKILNSDAHLQLSILRDLTRSASEQRDVNTIFHMVIEGMHRGIGLERVCIAFIQKHMVTARYALGLGTSGWKKEFDFDVGPFTENIFTHCIEHGGSAWLDEDFVKENGLLFPKEITGILGKVPCLMHILELHGKRFALFYADRADYGGVIDKDQYESFAHFAEQTQLTLSQNSNGNKHRAGFA